MNAHRSLFLAASLSLAACNSTGHSTRDAAVSSAQLTVHVVEASGGA